ncbi:MAG: transposase [Planctomycetota bacterium]
MEELQEIELYDEKLKWVFMQAVRYFGLTPSSHNSGKTKDRLGSITKDGSRFARSYWVSQ